MSERAHLSLWENIRCARGPALTKPMTEPFPRRLTEAMTCARRGLGALAPSPYGPPAAFGDFCRRKSHAWVQGTQTPCPLLCAQHTFRSPSPLPWGEVAAVRLSERVRLSPLLPRHQHKKSTPHGVLFFISGQRPYSISSILIRLVVPLRPLVLPPVMTTLSPGCRGSI